MRKKNVKRLVRSLTNSLIGYEVLGEPEGRKWIIRGIAEHMYKRTKPVLGVMIVGQTRLLFSDQMTTYIDWLKKMVNATGRDVVFFTMIEKDGNQIDYDNKLMHADNKFLAIDPITSFKQFSSLINNQVIKRFHQKISQFKNSDDWLKGCRSQWPKKMIIYDMIVDYEREHDIQIESFIRIRTDSFNMLKPDIITSLINKNMFYMNHDIFSFIPRHNIRHYCLYNLMYMIRDIKDIQFGCFYIRYFLDKNIPISGGGFKDQQSYKSRIHDNVTVYTCVLRSNVDKPKEIGLYKVQTHHGEPYASMHQFAETIGVTNFVVLSGQNQPGKTKYRITERGIEKLIK